jgi:hypothetical protein
VTSILVVKDVGFQGNGGVADLSVLDQNFSQALITSSVFPVFLGA